MWSNDAEREEVMKLLRCSMGDIKRLPALLEVAIFISPICLLLQHDFTGDHKIGLSKLLRVGGSSLYVIND